MRNLALTAALVALASSLAAFALLLGSSPERNGGWILACAALCALASSLLVLFFVKASTVAPLTDDAPQASTRFDASENPIHRFADVDVEQTAAPSDDDEGAALTGESVQDATPREEDSASAVGDGTDAAAVDISTRAEVSAETSTNQEWLTLVEECVELLDELERYKKDFDQPRVELVEHVSMRLAELLERSGVEVISDETSFDRLRHQPEGRAAARALPGAAITETLSPGFAVGRRVLRRARVRL